MDLLNAAKKQANRLKRLASQVDNLDLSQNLSDEGKNGTARIYEFYVSLRAICDLAHNWHLKLVTNGHAKVLRFPNAPASKMNYPFFEASSKSGNPPLFQVCLGVNISNHQGTTFAPDLSVQTASASNQPTVQDFVFGWDQKHSEENKLNRNATTVVAGHLRYVHPLATLQTRPFPSGPWRNKNAVITNSGFSTLKDSDLVILEISEVSECHPSFAAFKTRP